MECLRTASLALSGEENAEGCATKRIHNSENAVKMVATVTHPAELDS